MPLQLQKFAKAIRKERQQRNQDAVSKERRGREGKRVQSVITGDNP